MHDEQKSHIEIIANAYLERKLVIFVGAGVSMNSGLPSWDDLAKSSNKMLPLKQRTDLGTIGTKTKLLDHFEKFETYRLRSVLFEHVKNELTKDNPIPNFLHELIFDLANKTIVTTNYDNLLETYAQSQKLNFVVINDEKKAINTTNKQCILKIHGDIDSHDIVITKSDYERYYKRGELRKSVLISRTQLEGATLLFVGFSGTDPNINSILTRIYEQVEEYSPSIYMLISSSDIDANNLQLVKDKAIITISNVNKSEFDEYDISSDNFNSKVSTIKDVRGQEIAKILFYIKEISKVIVSQPDIEKIYNELIRYDNIKIISTKHLRVILDYLGYRDSISYDTWFINKEIMSQILSLKEFDRNHYKEILIRLNKFIVRELRDHEGRQSINIRKELSQIDTRTPTTLIPEDLLLNMHYCEVKRIIETTMRSKDYNDEVIYQLLYYMQNLGMYKDAWSLIKENNLSLRDITNGTTLFSQIHLQSINTALQRNIFSYGEMDIETFMEIKKTAESFKILKSIEKEVSHFSLHYSQFLIQLFDRSCLCQYLAELTRLREKLELIYSEALKGSVSFHTTKVIDQIEYEYQKYTFFVTQNYLPTFLWWEEIVITKEYVRCVCLRLACDNVYKRTILPQQFEEFPSPIELETLPYYTLINCVLTSDEVFIEQLERFYKISDFTVSRVDVGKFITAFFNMVEFSCKYNSKWSLLNMHSKQIGCFLQLFNLLKRNINTNDWNLVINSIKMLVEKCAPSKYFIKSLSILMRLIEEDQDINTLESFSQAKNLFVEKFTKVE